MSVAAFIERYFDPGSGPDSRTVRSWIDQGVISGRVIGKLDFVDAAAFERSTGNALADRILDTLRSRRDGSNRR